MAFQAPLLGYNTNVRHKGKLYHIQTEDSGVSRPHVVTHLFTDGGRIVASKKTTYAEHVGIDKLSDHVKKLMQAQHKAMFIALRDGTYDEDAPAAGQAAAVEASSPGTPAAARRRSSRPRRSVSPESRGAAQEHGPDTHISVKRPQQDGLYQSTRAASQVTERGQAPSSPRERMSIFGSDLLSEKSLDEVVLSYLASDDDC